MLENEYRFNKRFRDYVDRYCAEKGVTVEQAFEDEVVKGEFRRYTEV